MKLFPLRPFRSEPPGMLVATFFAIAGPLVVFAATRIGGVTLEQFWSGMFCLLFTAVLLTLWLDLLRDCRLRCDGNKRCEGQCTRFYMLVYLMILALEWMCLEGLVG